MTNPELEGPSPKLAKGTRMRIRVGDLAGYSNVALTEGTCAARRYIESVTAYISAKQRSACNKHASSALTVCSL